MNYPQTAESINASKTGKIEIEQPSAFDLIQERFKEYEFIQQYQKYLSKDLAFVLKTERDKGFEEAILLIRENWKWADFSNDLTSGDFEQRIRLAKKEKESI